MNHTPPFLGKCADPELQLDVDLMTLDFLFHSAILSILDEADQRRKGVRDEQRGDDALESVEHYLRMFKSFHRDHEASVELKFRLELLQFTVLYCRRLSRGRCTPSLDSLELLRDRNRARAQKWFDGQDIEEEWHTMLGSQNDIIQVDEDMRQRRCSDTLSNLHGGLARSSDHGLFFISVNAPALLDLLPTFMLLSAKAAPGTQPSTKWMIIAAEFMLQAACEQYFLRGCDSDTVFRDAFGWGCWQPDPDDMDIDSIADDLAVMDEVFRDEETETVNLDWATIRHEFGEEFLGVLNRHISIDDVESRYPIVKFEEKICTFLRALSRSIPLPIITQLEEGKLTGLSEEQTRDLKIRVGLLHRVDDRINTRS